MLGASSCDLTAQDFEYLLRSKHWLEELDISKNPLSNYFPLVLSLIQMLSPSLLILQMEDVGLRSDEFSRLFETCAQLQNLRMLNVAHNRQLLRGIVSDAVLFFAVSPQLQAIKLSYPIDTMVGDNPDARQITWIKKEFSDLINRQVRQLSALYKSFATQLAFEF